PRELPAMAAAGLTPTVYGMQFLELFLGLPIAAGAPIPFHLKVDTGMGRLGLRPEEIPQALSLIAKSGRVRAFEGVFTTLACGDDPNDPFTAVQLTRFDAVLGLIRDAGLSPACVHAANSGGVIDHPPSWLVTVRPGIMLYGIHPSSLSTRMDLRPALSVKGRL